MEKRRMVSLIKVHKTKKYIEGCYTYVGCEREGYIRISLSDGRELKKTLASDDKEVSGVYVVVKHRLQEIRYMDIKDIPEETVIIW